ncbi:hypothetical protein INR49_032452, partial [Caranx melampygus]
MEDMYIKPGNQERGWNDPPQFSYGLQMARGPQRNLLNKRAAPPVSGPESLYPPPASSDPLAPPPCGIAAPPLHPGPMRGQREGISMQLEQTWSEPDVEQVVQVFEQALTACRLGSIKGQVCNDVAKRLRILEDSWRSGRLSLPTDRQTGLTLGLHLLHHHPQRSTDREPPDPRPTRSPWQLSSALVSPKSISCTRSWA